MIIKNKKKQNYKDFYLQNPKNSLYYIILKYAIAYISKC